MADNDRIEKNRRNAARSTGPKSAEGKARTRLNAVSWQGAFDLMERLDALDDAAEADGDEVNGLLEDAAGEVPGPVGFDIEAEAFLLAVGVPRSALDSPWRWSGWTAGHARMALALMAGSAGLEPERLLDAARKNRSEAMEEMARNLAEAEAEAAKQEPRLARERRQAASSLMPDHFAVDKIVRYEGHLGKQMLQALHALERLQKMRAGQDVPAPVALDVTVNA